MFKQTKKLAKIAALSLLGLGCATTANATMVRDDFSAVINSSNVSGLTIGQTFTASVTYDNAMFSTDSSGSKTFLNPVFDLGIFSSFFSSEAMMRYEQIAPISSPTGNSYFEFFVYQGGKILTFTDDAYLGNRYSYVSNFPPVSDMSNFPQEESALFSVSYLQTDLTPPATNNVPEPESLALMGLGFLGMAAMRRKKAL